MKKLFKIFTNKIVVTAFFFLLQIAFTVLLLLVLTSLSAWVYIAFSIFSLFVCLFIMGKDANPGYKLAWVIPILLLPLFGGMMYISFGRTARLRRKERKRLDRIGKQSLNGLRDALDRTPALAAQLDEPQKKLAALVGAPGHAPLYDNTMVTYYPLGQSFWQALLADLEKAAHYIYLEYFIIERGKCWNAVLDILQRKAAQGVDVRVLYDDIGCLFTLPADYPKKLRSMGIKVHVFNKIKPTFNIRMNNRTHRKIAVIDGTVAFTGGINLADEYINEIDKHGHWKDTAVRLKGNGAQSFAVMFLQFWMLLEKETEPVNEYLPPLLPPENAPSGCVQPLASYPDQNVQLIEQGMMSMVNNARNYVYINTPYLIPDNEFVTALCLAAQSGVDVRITLPHIPDKRIVFIMTRSFYPVLLKAGVKIYEYLPGFVHAKSMLCDDKTAFAGTCNLDYRSFYLHYECGAFLYNVPALNDMKADYLATLDKCKQITYEEATDVTPVTKLMRSVLRLFAPLM